MRKKLVPFAPFALFFALFAVNAFDALAKDHPPPHPRQAEVDSLMRIAAQRIEVRDGQGAMALFRQVTQIDSNQAPAYRMLGAIYVGANQRDAAEQAYQRAQRIDDSADSWFGLGMVALTSRDRRGRWRAVHRFREAIHRDWHQADARYQLAQALYNLGEPGGEFELQQLIRISPTYTPAYVTLSQWEEHKSEGWKEAVKWCERGLKAMPDDPDLLVRRAELFTVGGDHDEDVTRLTDRFRSQPTEIRVLPFIAQAHLTKGRLGAAQEAFQTYLDRLNPGERACYEDISLVGTLDEVRAFQALPEGATPEFLRQFWARRDADLAEGVNRRRLEHYRRVWVARTQFSRGRKPWDRRGEVYIRYGEPDFRQRSEGSEFKGAMNAKVQAVRRKMAAFLYGATTISADDDQIKDLLKVLGNAHEAQGMTEENVKVPIDAVTTLLTAPGKLGPDNTHGRTTTSDFGIGPAYPLRGLGDGYTIVSLGGSAAVPWESWIYTRIAGGIEFVFTDESLNDTFDFAPVPKVYQPANPGISVKESAGPQLLARMDEYSPEKVFAEVRSDLPALYLTRSLLDPLPAHVASAAFRSKGDATQVEVYLGVPLKGMRSPMQDWQGERTVVVYDQKWQEVRRVTDRTTLPILSEAQGEAIDVMPLPLAPGDYFLAVKIAEGDSGRTALIQDSLRVESYGGDSLRISDIELARRIVPASGQVDRFTKGDQRVIPAPARAFGKDQGVFLYFEAYNLRLNKQGQTNYRVDYDIRGKKGVGDLVLSGLGQLIGRNAQENGITVSYEATGVDKQEAVHTALDLRKSPSGDYTLRVTVTDLNSGTKAERETLFRVVE